MNSVAQSEEITLLDAAGSSGFVCDGDWIESKDQDPDGDVRIIQLADIGLRQYVNKSRRFMTMAAARRLGCTFLTPGDLLLARMPDPIGRTCIFPGDPRPCVTAVDVCVIRTANSVVDSRWLLHRLNSPEFLARILRDVNGTTRQRIPSSALKRIRFAKPCLPEQRRIAAILDQAESLRTKRQQVQVKLDILIQSTFVEMFGNQHKFDLRPISETCELVVDCVNRTAPLSDAVTPYKMIRTSNVKSGVVDVSNVRYVSRPVFDRWNRRATPKRFDVILTREAPVGEIGILDSDDDVFLGQRLMLYRADPKILTPEYLMFAMLSPYVQEQLVRGSSGSTVKHLSLPLCRSFSLPVPPLAMQQQFTFHVRKYKAIARAAAHQSRIAQTLFASLQHRAFRGEL